MTAWISPLGLYQVYPDLFLLLQVPGELDKSLVVDTILTDTAELEVLYSDPIVLKGLIGRWSTKMMPIWSKLCETLHYDYNPIHNYDRTEERTLGIERNATGDTSSNGSNDTYRNGYDSGALVHSDQETGSNTGHSSSSENVGEAEKIRTMGNIGVTTTQQMIESQREVVKFDIIQYIADEFKAKFCLLVY